MVATDDAEPQEREYFDDEAALGFLHSHLSEESLAALLELLRRAVLVAGRLKVSGLAAGSVNSDFNFSAVDPLTCLVWAAQDCSVRCCFALDDVLYDESGAVSSTFRSWAAESASAIRDLPPALRTPVVDGFAALDELMRAALAIPSDEAADLFYSEDEGEFNPDAARVILEVAVAVCRK